MGREIETLADVPCRPGGVLVVGINPAITSVTAGHYYQGTLGKRLWGRLRRAGLPVGAVTGEEDVEFTSAGHGLTDLVKRATVSADEITEEELQVGLMGTRYNVRSWKPGLIILPFKKSAEVLLGKHAIKLGQGPVFEGTRTFLLSGPYAPRAEADRIDAELSQLLGPDLSQARSVSVTPQADVRTSQSHVLHTNHALTVLNVGRTQRITDSDIEHGQIRFPHDAKRFFPRNRGTVQVLLRGEILQCACDPRNGPDQERSAVLRVSRSMLSRLVMVDEVLKVSRRPDGIILLS